MHPSFTRIKRYVDNPTWESLSLFRSVEKIVNMYMPFQIVHIYANKYSFVNYYFTVKAPQISLFLGRIDTSSGLHELSVTLQFNYLAFFELLIQTYPLKVFKSSNSCDIWNWSINVILVTTVRDNIGTTTSIISQRIKNTFFFSPQWTAKPMFWKEWHRASKCNVDIFIRKWFLH